MTHVDAFVRAPECDPSVHCAETEAHLGQVAWDTVAPEDGLLPEHATPLQLMLHTRMVTSEFVFRMAKIHEERRRQGLPTTSRSAALAAAKGADKPGPRIYLP